MWNLKRSCYYSQLGDNEHKPEACFKACVYYHPTMEAGQNTRNKLSAA